MHNTIDRYPFFITQLTVIGARQLFQITDGR
jgi:hypothetical protein